MKTENLKTAVITITLFTSIALLLSCKTKTMPQPSGSKEVWVYERCDCYDLLDRPYGLEKQNVDVVEWIIYKNGWIQGLSSNGAILVNGEIERTPVRQNEINIILVNAPTSRFDPFALIEKEDTLKQLLRPNFTGSMESAMIFKRNE